MNDYFIRCWTVATFNNGEINAGKIHFNNGYHSVTVIGNIYEMKSDFVLIDNNG